MLITSQKTQSSIRQAYNLERLEYTKTKVKVKNKTFQNTNCVKNHLINHKFQLSSDFIVNAIRFHCVCSSTALTLLNRCVLFAEHKIKKFIGKSLPRVKVN